MNAEGMRLMVLAFIADLCKKTTDNERMESILQFLDLIGEHQLVADAVELDFGLDSMAFDIVQNELNGATLETFVDTRMREIDTGKGS